MREQATQLSGEKSVPGKTATAKTQEVEQNLCVHGVARGWSRVGKGTLVRNSIREEPGMKSWSLGVMVGKGFEF